MSLPTDSTNKEPSHNLNRQVAQYSIAAAVAGVSVLALAQSAGGEVVVTRKTIPIPVVPFTAPEPVRISMANNGVDNFSLLLSSFPSDFSSRQLLVAGVGARQPGLHNQILTGGSFYGKALALPRGANIGPSAINPSAAFSSYFFALVERTNASAASRS